MDVVPNARAIPCGPAGACDVEDRFFFHRYRDQFTQDVAGFLDVHPGAHLWVSANRIEIAQGNGLEPIGVGEVLQDHFHHVFRAGIGAAGLQRGFFCHHEIGDDIIDGSRGAEYHPGVTQFGELVEETH